MGMMLKDARIALVACLIVVTASTTARTAAPQEPSRSKTSTSPMFYVSVTDNSGHPMLGLRPSNFNISLENVHPSINYFSDRDIPTAIGILFRVSGSMRTKGPQYTETLAKGIVRFTELSNPGDQFFTVAIGPKPLVVTDWTPQGTALADGVEEIGKGGLKGPAALYDACALAIGKMRETQLSKRVLLLISDGEDSASRSSEAKVRDLLEQSDVIVFSIAIIDPASDVLGGPGRSVLQELAAASGGTVFFPGSAPDALQCLALFAEEIRHQYAIGISVDGLKGDGKRHAIRVDLKSKEVPESSGPKRTGIHLNVTTRKAFFDAPKTAVQ